MLKKMFKMMKKGNKGFTLVELMVVVVIIGVLTAIAVPVYNNVTAKAKINSVAANLRIINGAISQYQTDKGEFPNLNMSNLVPAYIQSSPDQNPKGVTYRIAYVSSTGSISDTEVAGSNLQGVATVAADAGIKGLSAGDHILSSVQTIINTPES